MSSNVRPRSRWFAVVIVFLVLPALFLVALPASLPVAADEPAQAVPEGEIAYVHEGDIYLLDLATRESQRLTTDGTNRDPAWSPDGQWLAFASDRSGNYDIYQMRADGSEITRLTNSPLSEFAPAFSPNGALFFVQPYEGLAVVKQSSLGTYDVIYEDKAVGPGWWASDLNFYSASRFAITRHDHHGPSIVSLVDIELQQVVNIDALNDKKDRGYCFETSYDTGVWANSSPILVFLSNADCVDLGIQGYRSGIFLLEPDNPGSAIRTIFSLSTPPHEGNLFSLDWSPDDQWFVFHKYIARDRSDEIWIISADGGEPVKVSEVGISPAWRPVSDTGFRPNPDGYHFPNYGGVSYPDFTINDMRRTFGDAAICQAVTDGVCIAKSTALRWNAKVHEVMEGGHCDGMAVTSLRFFKNLDNPANFQTNADETFDLNLSSVRRNIAYYFAHQMTSPVNDYKWQIRQKTPVEILDLLRNVMVNDASDPTTLFVRQAGQGGHAITPYAIEDRGNGVYWVKVYDNNHPKDVNRHVEINTTNNGGNGAWSYDMGGSIGIWSGDANTDTLGIVPISEYAKEPECPFCDDARISSGVPAGQVWLNGTGHLLITDSQGRRIGYVGNQFVNEVPGAFENIIDNGLGIETEPIYTLPLTETYTILLDGQTTTQAGAAEVAQFGPGYAVAVEDVPVGPTSQSQLTFAADGTQATYESNAAGEVTLTLALDGASDSRQFRVVGADVGAGQSVMVQDDTPTGQMIFNGSATNGKYDLNIRRASAAGEHVFFHSDVAMSADSTHFVNYGAWDGSGPITVQIDHDSDGTIDETRQLANQEQHVYLPLIQR